MKRDFDQPTGRRAVAEQKKYEAWETIFPYLEVLSGMESLSRHEDLVRDYLLKEAEKLGIETRTDEVGNLWLLSDAPEGEILLCAHMDKVGHAQEAVVEGTTVRGRLDDALGTSIIMAALKKGHRPSVLFTVEEETGLYGSEFAVQAIMAGKSRKPKLVLILDVSVVQQRGVGPLCYTSSGGGRPFPEAPINAAKTILQRAGLRASFVPGHTNDSFSFRLLPEQGTLTLQIHVDNMHSRQEVADIADIKEAAKVLETILQHHEEIPNVEPAK